MLFRSHHHFVGGDLDQRIGSADAILLDIRPRGFDVDNDLLRHAADLDDERVGWRCAAAAAGQAEDQGVPHFHGKARFRRTVRNLDLCDVDAGEALIDEALAILESVEAPDPAASFDALIARATIEHWRADPTRAAQFLEQALAIAVDAGRKDLQTMAVQALAQIHLSRLELDEAEREGAAHGIFPLIRGRKGTASGFTYFDTPQAGVTLEVRQSPKA